MNKKKKFNELRKNLGKMGYIVQGTLTERYQNYMGKKVGPYYQWTFKKNGKTVTVNLSKEQAALFREAISNYKELKKILSDMKSLSRQILEESAPGVHKRKKKA